MLVDGENEVYFLDRDNCVFQVVKRASKNLASKTRTLDAGLMHVAFRCLASHSCIGRINIGTYRTLC